MSEAKTAAVAMRPPEARPLRFEQLRACQKKALEQLIQKIRQATTLDPTGCDHDADDQRSSPVLFLEGTRGSSKTSLQITLQRIFEKSEARDFYHKNWKHFDLHDLARRVVWLPPLELEPLPRSTNLLTALLTRFEPRSGRESPTPSASQYLDPDLESPIDVLQRLIFDAHIAWNDRQEMRDLEDAASEARAARIRTTLNRDISDLLDRLAASRRDKEDPIFVLPVDDFDLNPLRCLELLYLVRMIRSPRLLLFISGQIELAERIAGLHFRKAFFEAAGESHRFPSQPGDDFAWADSLGAHALRKLIPPAQRVTIENVDLEDAVDYKPLGGADQSLGDLLKQFVLPQGDAQRKKGLTLAGFLRPETDRIEAESPLYGAYPAGGLLLSSRLRDIDELYSRLDLALKSSQGSDGDLDSGKLHRELVGHLAEYCKAAFEEEVNLTPHERLELLNAVRQNHVGQWEFDKGVLRATSEVGPGYRVKSGKIRATDFVFYEARDFLIYPRSRDGAEPRVQGNVPLGIRTSARLLVLFDLLSIQSPPRVFGQNMLDLSERVWAATRWDKGLFNEFLVPWPMPGYRTYHQFSLLRYQWNVFHRGYSKENRKGLDSDWNEAEYLAWVWVSINTAALKGDFFCSEDPRARFKEARIKGETLKATLAAAAESGENELWEARAARMAAPEFGIAKEQPDEILIAERRVDAARFRADPDRFKEAFQEDGNPTALPPVKRLHLPDQAPDDLVGA